MWQKKESVFFYFFAPKIGKFRSERTMLLKGALEIFWPERTPMAAVDFNFNAMNALILNVHQTIESKLCVF